MEGEPKPTDTHESHRPYTHLLFPPQTPPLAGIFPTLTQPSRRHPHHSPPFIFPTRTPQYTHSKGTAAYRVHVMQMGDAYHRGQIRSRVVLLLYCNSFSKADHGPIPPFYQRPSNTHTHTHTETACSS